LIFFSINSIYSGLKLSSFALKYDSINSSSDKCFIGEALLLNGMK